MMKTKSLYHIYKRLQENSHEPLAILLSTRYLNDFIMGDGVCWFREENSAVFISLSEDKDSTSY